MAVSEIEIRLAADIARLQQNMNEARRVVGSATESMSRAVDTVKTAFASIGVGVGLSGIIALSDQYAKFTAQLKLATQSQREYAQAYADVKRISTSAQTDLAATGTLYARIANSTRDLGVSQSKVADITESVTQSLRVSGATTEEAASATLQLSQAFSAGALRGEEFNAVNDAAPRLIKAIADGLGVPIGALRQLAADGQITSKVLADTLPKALDQLRVEAAQVQTIGGAFTVLKNNVLEFTGVQAQANGTVAVLTKGIGLLADNLQLVAGVLATLGAAKFAVTLAGWATQAYTTAAANTALLQSTLATSEAQVVATGTTAVLAAARVNELRTSILAADADVGLAIALNGLVPAQARAAAAAEAHTVALAAQGVAATAVSRGTGLLGGALGLLGGPIGLVVTVLGLAATAWSVYQSSAEKANAAVAADTEESAASVLANLEKQNAKLRERIALAKQLKTPEIAQEGGPAVEKLASTLKQINDLKAQGTSLDAGDKVLLVSLQGIYDGLLRTLAEQKGLKADLNANDKAALSDLIAIREKLTGVNKTYLEDLKKLENAREKGVVGEKEYIALVSQLATETYKGSEAGKAAIAATNKETEAYGTLISSIREAIETNKLELVTGENATASQKARAKLDQELASGKLKLSAGHLAAARAALVEQAATEQLLKAQQVEKDIAKFREQGIEASLASTGALEIEAATYGKVSDARDIANVALKINTELEKFLNDQRIAGKTLTDDEVDSLRAEAKVRTQVEQAALAQSKAYGYATQLATENKKFAAESITDEKARAAALLVIDADTWRQRIDLVAEGSDARKKLESEYATWYSNQQAKPQLEEQKKFWESIDKTAHDTFVSLQDGGKSAAQRLKDSFKNVFFDWLYAQTLKKWIINLQGNADLTSVGGVAQAASTAIGGGGGGIGGLLSGAGAIKDVLTGGFDQLGATITSKLADLGEFLTEKGFESLGETLGTNALALGNLGSILGGAGAGIGIGSLIGGNMKLGGLNATATSTLGAGAGAAIGTFLLPGIGTALGAALGGALGGTLNRLFGRGPKEVTAQGFKGTFGPEGLTGAETFQDWLQKGGWFKSDKRGTDTKPIDEALQTSLTDAFNLVKISTLDFARTLGAPVDVIRNFTKDVNLALTGDATKDQQAFTDLLTSIGDELATKLIPNIADLGVKGETASATLQRLSTDYATLDAILNTIGKTFGAVGVGSLEARERLIGLAGGLDALATNTKTFSDNFLTEAERLAPVQKYVTDQLAALGLAGVTTRDQFKAVVLGLDLTTEAGAKEYTQLLALSGAFAQVTQSTTDVVQSATDAQQAWVEAANAIYEAGLSARDDSKAALQSVSSALADSLVRAKEAAAAFRSLNDALLIGDTSTLSAEQKYAAAKEQFQTATGAGIGPAEQAFLAASKAFQSGTEAFARDFAAVLQRNAAEATAGDQSAAAYANFIKNLQGHAAGGTARGLVKVGENGPEMAYFGQSAHIYPAGQTRDMLSGSGAGPSDEAIKENTDMLQKLLDETQENTKQARKTADLLTGATRGGQNLLVKVLP